MWLKNLTVNGKPTDLRVEGRLIAEVAPADGTREGRDFGGAVAWPGLIDVHTHGAAGGDTCDGDLTEISRFYARNGVTSFLPTTTTIALDRLREITSTLPRVKNGAVPLGYHLEGPFISPKYIGAQNSEFLATPRADGHTLDGFRNIKMITLAPEIENAASLIDECVARGITVCLGHTGCDYCTAVAAIERGASCLSHTYNAMPPLLHREPGPIGAGLVKGIYAQLICDGVHVARAAVLALYRMFGADKVVLISDSMRATGLPDGTYELGGQNMIVRGDVARTADGHLAGGTSTLLHCVKTAVSFGIPEADAVKMASENPARLIGANKGVIAPGKDADLLILDDDKNPSAVMVEGEMIEL